MKIFIAVPALAGFALLVQTGFGQATKAPAELNFAAPTGVTSQAVTAQLSPIPLYPGNGVIPQELAANLVFFDPQKGNLVVSYPYNIDDATAAPSSGPRKEFRVELKKQVNAMLYVAFGKNSSGQTTYSYNVVNKSDAKQDVGSVSLAIPSPGSNLPRTAVSRDLVDQASPAITGSGGWDAAALPADKGVVQVRWSKTGEHGVAAGSTAGGFAVASVLRPGFMFATVRGLSAGPELTDIQAPARVHEALTALDESGYNQQTVLTLGPQFPGSANRVAIAANFLEGISVLTQHRYMDAQSPFVKETIASLRRYLAGTALGIDGPAADYVGPSLALQSKASAGLEAQIAEAMKISLQ